MNDTIYIQVLNGGNWQTVNSTPAHDMQRVLIEMQQAKERNPDLRVRAVDESNRLIDML